MDWIHCNKCFAQLASTITLHLTSCGHMFCNNCIDGVDKKESVCILCQLPCSIMKLVPDMKPEIQEYFTDPEEIIKKCCEVFQFQKQHRRRLLSYLFQSTKKFYTARGELKRLSELCRRQHEQIKEYKKVIIKLESEQASQSLKQLSPFNIPISPGSHRLSPNIQSTPTYKRPAKSTPYNSYHSNLVTPSRISKQRSLYNVQSQKSNNSNKISSTVFTPPFQESGGVYRSQRSNKSEIQSSPNSPGIMYSGYGNTSHAF